MADRDGLPWVAVPERLDRRMRLGPFASGYDAIKFATAAAAGAVLSLAIEPWVGLPVVLVGAVITLWHPDGEGLDDRLAALVRWSVRRVAAEARVTAPDHRGPEGPRSTIAFPDGRQATFVRAGGVPLAFLPPSDLAHQFELYRDLLRSVEGGLIVSSTTAPIYPGSLLPPEAPLLEVERGPHDGYCELVSLLARRRSVRRVLLVLAQNAPGEEGARRLEAATELLCERLADLGVRADRLRDRSLVEAARRLGLPGGGTLR